MADEEVKKNGQEEDAKKVDKSKLSSTQDELDDIDSKLDNIRNALDKIMDRQGTQLQTEESRRRLHEKALRDFQDKQERKKTDDTTTQK